MSAHTWEAAISEHRERAYVEAQQYQRTHGKQRYRTWRHSDISAHTGGSDIKRGGTATSTHTWEAATSHVEAQRHQRTHGRQRYHTWRHSDISAHMGGSDITCGGLGFRLWFRV
eukprot:1155180-Pelagomonas_calceolata.AAC.5